MTDLFLKVRTHREQDLPFVLFCKPDSDRVVGQFQKNDHLYFLESFEEKGFVFAPFEADTIPFLPVEFSDVLVEKTHFRDFVLEEKKIKDVLVGNDFFETLVEKGVEAIQQGNFSKVVLSRKEEVEMTLFDIEFIFKRMISNYPSAFKYCFYHPKIGLWLGATPEQFLQINGNDIKTVALAGTQVAAHVNTVVWENKEKEEQQFVTDFIMESLSDLVKEITISSPYTVKAGNLVHIKTDISAKLKSKKLLKNIIETLHPTPAVCGLPKQKAKEFILQNEGYKREYYSGFLGELNIDLASFRTQQSDLFVNLRCMKIKSATAEIFVGGGITKDSNPRAEYIETVNKSMTMKKIIQ
ncbi:chorismate-binding protein [Flavobacterium sp. XGLA_31]|uniref:chorismate-binding protein n=1 Tax=Flavobacterium sp. XGLA_31 TaxID=3447666 RepID=UPI003F32F96F